jgi:8-oxo-dGTP pyrophosphatase MutT (NUDIX family)
VTPRIGVAVAVVTYEGDVLVGWHHKTKSWSLPGGKVDLGEHPATAALRELEEESGITDGDIRRDPDIHPLSPSTHPRWVTGAWGLDGQWWTTLVYRVWVPTRLATQVTAPDEIDSFQWPQFRELPQLRPLTPALAAMFEPGLTYGSQSW